MSILNVSCNGQRALVAVDTRAAFLHGITTHRLAAVGVRTEEAPRETSKLLPMAHANAVIAGRGTTAYLLDVFAASCLCRSLDEIAIAMPSVLPRCAEALEQRLAAMQCSEALGDFRQEILLVGWSDRETAVVPNHYRQRQRGGLGFDLTLVEKSVAPWDDSWGESPEVHDEQGMLVAATHQVAMIRSTLGDAATAIGGRLIVAALTRAGISVRQAGALS